MCATKSNHVPLSNEGIEYVCQQLERIVRNDTQSDDIYELYRRLRVELKQREERGQR